MQKESSKYIVCELCSKPAIDGSNPPRCAECSKLVKQAEESAASIRDVDKLVECFNSSKPR